MTRACEHHFIMDHQLFNTNYPLADQIVDPDDFMPASEADFAADLIRQYPSQTQGEKH